MPKNPDKYHEPVGGLTPDKLGERMNASIDAVRALWPRGTGVTLLVYDFGGPGRGLAYVSNAERETMIRTMEEWLERQRNLS